VWKSSDFWEQPEQIYIHEKLRADWTWGMLAIQKISWPLKTGPIGCPGTSVRCVASQKRAHFIGS